MVGGGGRRIVVYDFKATRAAEAVKGGESGTEEGEDRWGKEEEEEAGDERNAEEGQHCMRRGGRGHQRRPIHWRGLRKNGSYGGGKRKLWKRD